MKQLLRYKKMIQMKNKEQMKADLIQNDMETINQQFIIDGFSNDYLYNILNEGFKGYNNYTKEELYEEWKERGFE